MTWIWFNEKSLLTTIDIIMCPACSSCPPPCPEWSWSWPEWSWPVDSVVANNIWWLSWPIIEWSANEKTFELWRVRTDILAIYSLCMSNGHLCSYSKAKRPIHSKSAFKWHWNFIFIYLSLSTIWFWLNARTVIAVFHVYRISLSHQKSAKESKKTKVIN